MNLPTRLALAAPGAAFAVGYALLLRYVAREGARIQRDVTRAMLDYDPV